MRSVNHLCANIAHPTVGSILHSLWRPKLFGTCRAIVVKVVCLLDDLLCLVEAKDVLDDLLVVVITLSVGVGRGAKYLGIFTEFIFTHLCSVLLECLFHCADDHPPGNKEIISIVLELQISHEVLLYCVRREKVFEKVSRSFLLDSELLPTFCVPFDLL